MAQHSNQSHTVHSDHILTTHTGERQQSRAQWRAIREYSGGCGTNLREILETLENVPDLKRTYLMCPQPPLKKQNWKY